MATICLYAVGGEKNPTNMVSVAQLAELRIVVPKVTGSSPVRHPNFYVMTENEKRWEALGIAKDLQDELKEGIAKLFESENKVLPIVERVYAKTMGGGPKTPMK